MTYAVALVVGGLVARALWSLSRALRAAPGLQRTNFRGVVLPTAGGIFLIGVALFAAAAQALFNAFDVIIGSVGAEALVSLVVVGYGLLGLWDDLVGASDTTGFAGHLRALGRGHLTTGAVKLFGGGALALVVVADRSSGWQFLADAALIALAANFANLLDRRPGRVLKVALLAYVPLAVVGGAAPIGVAIAPVMGAAVALAPEDLRERCMLGDTGANILGGVLGFATVYLCPPTVRWIVLGALLALNVLAEFVSYTKLIAAFPPLRIIDSWGRASDTPA